MTIKGTAHKATRLCNLHSRNPQYKKPSTKIFWIHEAFSLPFPRKAARWTAILTAARGKNQMSQQACRTFSSLKKAAPGTTESQPLPPERWLRVEEGPAHAARAALHTCIKALHYSVNNKNQLETQNSPVSWGKRGGRTASTVRRAASRSGETFQWEAMTEGLFYSLQEKY